MSTTYTITPGYGADIFITEEGKIAIMQDQPGIDNVTIYLSAEETRSTHRALQALTDQQKKTLSTLTTKGLTRGFLPCDPESTQRMVETGILIPHGPRFYSNGHIREYSLSPIARQHFYGKD